MNINMNVFIVVVVIIILLLVIDIIIIRAKTYRDYVDLKRINKIMENDLKYIIERSKKK